MSCAYWREELVQDKKREDDIYLPYMKLEIFFCLDENKKIDDFKDEMKMIYIYTCIDSTVEMSNAFKLRIR